MMSIVPLVGLPKQAQQEMGTLRNSAIPRWSSQPEEYGRPLHLKEHGSTPACQTDVIITTRGKTREEANFAAVGRFYT